MCIFFIKSKLQVAITSDNAAKQLYIGCFDAENGHSVELYEPDSASEDDEQTDEVEHVIFDTSHQNELLQGFDNFVNFLSDNGELHIFGGVSPLE